MSSSTKPRPSDLHPEPHQPIVPLAVSPKMAAKLLGFSLSKTYEVIAEGALDARKHRGRTIIMRASIDKFLADLPGFQPQERLPHLIGNRGK